MFCSLKKSKNRDAPKTFLRNTPCQVEYLHTYKRMANNEQAFLPGIVETKSRNFMLLRESNPVVLGYYGIMQENTISATKWSTP